MTVVQRNGVCDDITLNVNIGTTLGSSAKNTPTGERLHNECMPMAIRKPTSGVGAYCAIKRVKALLVLSIDYKYYCEIKLSLYSVYNRA